MHSSCSSGCNYYDFCTGDFYFFGFHIYKNRTCRIPVFVLYYFNCGSKIYDCNLIRTVKNFIAESAHNFRTGVIFAGVHSFTAGSASVRGYHCTVRLFIEFYTQLIEPFDCLRRFCNKRVYKFGLSVKVPAAESVKIMLCRRIVRLIGSLYTAFRHHRICVPYTKFCNKKHFCAGIIRFYCGGRSGSASADYQNVGFVIRAGKIYTGRIYARFCFKYCCKFKRSFFSFVRPDFKFGELRFNSIGMIFF